MATMVDVEKLKGRMEDSPAYRLGGVLLPKSLLFWIDELAVEVLGTPDVLRESSNQTIIEALHVLNDEVATRLGVKIMVDTYDVLQAKKENHDGMA